MDAQKDLLAKKIILTGIDEVQNVTGGACRNMSFNNAQSIRRSLRKSTRGWMALLLLTRTA